MSLENRKVFVGSFTFGGKSKKYPYTMAREADIREAIRKLKEKLCKVKICGKKYTCTNCKAINEEFGFVKCVKPVQEKVK